MKFPSNSIRIDQQKAGHQEIKCEIRPRSSQNDLKRHILNPNEWEFKPIKRWPYHNWIKSSSLYNKIVYVPKYCSLVILLDAYQRISEYIKSFHSNWPLVTIWLFSWGLISQSSRSFYGTQTKSKAIHQN